MLVAVDRCCGMSDCSAQHLPRESLENRFNVLARIEEIEPRFEPLFRFLGTLEQY